MNSNLFVFHSSLITMLLTQTLFCQPLQSQLNTIFDNNQLMGMSVYVFDGDNEATYNYGLRNLNQNLPIDNATKYRVASISKSFTALGLMKLYDQGFFALDDNISTYLGYNVNNPNFSNVPITFRMLLSHTSSLQDGSGYGAFLAATYNQSAIPDISALLTQGGSYSTANMFRTEMPGTYFNYSNINFGLIGTLIEKISNQRFDIYMKNEILIPLNITGSYNIQDLPEIANLATLYRNVSGWTPQFDNYNGIMPTTPNLESYEVGSNGLYFSPQGGLRISASEIGTFLKFIRENGATVPGLISQPTLTAMKTVTWTDNGANGDDYYGLFNKWSLGLHYANTGSADLVCDSNTFGNFIGHTGEAYGLISDAFYSENENVGFVVITNGSFSGYQSNASSFYAVEDQVFSALCSYFNSQLNTQNVKENEVQFINPVTNGKIEMHCNFEIDNVILADLKGVVLLQQKSSSIDVSAVQTGIYILKIFGKDFTITKKIMIN